MWKLAALQGENPKLPTGFAKFDFQAHHQAAFSAVSRCFLPQTAMSLGLSVFNVKSCLEESNPRSVYSLRDRLVTAKSALQQAIFKQEFAIPIHLRACSST